jgi:hypothetical protein
MPTFCRHNRLLQNCPICAREQDVELRPAVSSGAPRTGSDAGGSRERSGSGSAAARRRTSHRAAGGRDGVRVRRLDRAVDDGYRSSLVPGLRSSVDAERLAEELAFAARRLERLASDPPGLYAEVAGGGELEERIWLAFLIAYLCPLDGAEPFVGISSARTTWASGELPSLEGVPTGPRTAYDPARGDATLAAYRAWADRAGSQQVAFAGEPGWSPERRFARVFERLALAGFQRDARFDLLVTLGRLGLFELVAGALALGGDDEVTLGAKRALGIGDPLLLERRAAALADACGLPLEALDVGFYNWHRGERATLGLGTDSEPDPEALAGARDALGL